MYDTEAKITTDPLAELKMSADWPVIWLQDPGSVEILRKLLPDEILPALKKPVERFEFPILHALGSHLQLGDRIIVRCLSKGESLG
jgi:hypothetical protein